MSASVLSVAIGVSLLNKTRQSIILALHPDRIDIAVNHALQPSARFLDMSQVEVLILGSLSHVTTV
jgi:hypothetical protein